MASTGTAQRKMFRLQWKFWLDIEKPEEADLSDYCGSLKEQNKFTSTIRDGLRLIRDLRNQQLSVLFELFPWVNAWLEERAEIIAESKCREKNDPNKGGEGNDSLARVEQKLDFLLMREATGGGGILHAAQQSTRALPARTNNPSDALAGMDIDSKKVDSGKTNVQNFFASLGSTSAVNPKKVAVAAQLPLLPGHNKPPKKKKTQAVVNLDDTGPMLAIEEALEPAPSFNPQKIIGAGLNFAAPSFDDLEVHI